MHPKKSRDKARKGFPDVIGLSHCKYGFRFICFAFSSSQLVPLFTRFILWRSILQFISSTSSFLSWFFRNRATLKFCVVVTSFVSSVFSSAQRFSGISPFVCNLQFLPDFQSSPSSRQVQLSLSAFSKTFGQGFSYHFLCVTDSILFVETEGGVVGRW